jgi:4'-phosphopantetheinyl transferase
MSMEINWPNLSHQVELAADEAHVWAAPLVKDQGVWDKSWRTLASAERDRAQDFRLDDPRRRYVIARAALRRLLGGYLGMPPAAIEIVSEKNGKPRLADSHVAMQLDFNVSHSGDLALIAVATGCSVGIDVERMREIGHGDRIAQRFFHPLESEALLATPAEVRGAAFLRCWTGKEAVLKALGTGISGSLADFQVPTSEVGQGWVKWSHESQGEGRTRCWLQHLAPCDHYLAAIACVGRERLIRCYTFAP